MHNAGHGGRRHAADNRHLRLRHADARDDARCAYRVMYDGIISDETVCRAVDFNIIDWNCYTKGAMIKHFDYLKFGGVTLFMGNIEPRAIAFTALISACS